MSMYSDDEKNKHFTGAETVYSYEGCIWDDTQLPQYLGGYNGDPVATGDFPVDERGVEVPVHPVALQVACDISERISKAGFNGIRYRIMDAGFLHGPLGVKRTWRDTAGKNRSAYRVLPGLSLRWTSSTYRWFTAENDSGGFEFYAEDPIKSWRERCLRSTSAIIMSDSVTDGPLCAVLLYDLRYRNVRGDNTGILVQLIPLRSGDTWGGLARERGAHQQGDYLYPVQPYPSGDPGVLRELHTDRLDGSYRDSYTKVKNDRSDPHDLEQVQSYKESTRQTLLAHFNMDNTTGSEAFVGLTRAHGMRAHAYKEAMYDQDAWGDEPFIPDRKLPTNIRTQVRKLVKRLGANLNPPALDIDGRECVVAALLDVKFELGNRVGRASDRLGKVFDTHHRENPAIADFEKQFSMRWGSWTPRQTLGDLVRLLAQGSPVHDLIERVPEEILSVLVGERQAYQEEWHYLKDHMKYVIREDLTSGFVWHTEIGDARLRALYTEKGLPTALEQASADRYPCRLYHSWDAWEKRFNDDPIREQMATLQALLIASDNREEAVWVSEASCDPIRYKQGWETAVSGWKKVPNSTPYVKGLGWAFRRKPLSLEDTFGRKRGNNIFIIEG